MTDLRSDLRSDLDGELDADGLVEVCRRAAQCEGDVATIVAEEVRRAFPLRSADDRERLTRLAIARLVGLGDLDPLLRDPTIDEVLVNSDCEVWVDRGGELRQAGRLDGQPVAHLVERILAPIGRRVDRTSPVVDARLADGSRVCAVLPPVAVDGAVLSIRRFPTRARPIEHFSDPAGIGLVREVIAARCNLVVCGATSSGKTSLLSALLADLADERVLVMEDTCELVVESERIVRLEARPAHTDGPPPVSLADLVRTALRLRPDRLVVGEVRGDEVVALVQAMNTGHDGSMATCHANGPLDALYRLETLLLQAAPAWPLAAIRQQLARSIDVIVHVERDGCSGQRRVESVGEVVVPDPGRDDRPQVRPLAASRSGALEIVGELTRRRDR